MILPSDGPVRAAVVGGVMLGAVALWLVAMVVCRVADEVASVSDDLAKARCDRV